MIFTDENLDEILSNNKIVILQLSASWCAPCKQLEPIMKGLIDEYPNLPIGKMDVTENSETTTKYRVNSIPTIIFFMDGKEVERTMGLVKQKDLSQIILNLI